MEKVNVVHRLDTNTPKLLIAQIEYLAVGCTTQKH